MTNQVIPEAAVAAAAKASAGAFGEEPNKKDYAHVRLVLEAAAPHMLADAREETRLAHVDAVVNAESVGNYKAAIDAVNKLLDEKYKLWAAICGNTCSKEIVGVDHDAIADEVADAIRATITEALV